MGPSVNGAACAGSVLTAKPSTTIAGTSSLLIGWTLRSGRSVPRGTPTLPTHDALYEPTLRPHGATHKAALSRSPNWPGTDAATRSTRRRVAARSPTRARRLAPLCGPRARPGRADPRSHVEDERGSGPNRAAPRCRMDGAPKCPSQGASLSRFALCATDDVHCCRSQAEARARQRTRHLLAWRLEPPLDASVAPIRCAPVASADGGGRA